MPNPAVPFRRHASRGLKLFACAAIALAGLAREASAQIANPAPAPVTSDLSWFGLRYGTTLAPNTAYGLIGQTYAGVDYTYIHENSSVPNTLHQYSFVSNVPVSAGLDGAIKYDYTTGNQLGRHLYENDLYASATGYLPFFWGKPFVTGDAGWAWAKTATRHVNSFAYAASTGVEFQVAAPLVVSPYIKYEARPHLSEHDWDYGLRATYRLAVEWSATIGAQIDEHHDLEYTFGVNRHF